MEHEFDLMEPNFVGPVKVKALASGDSGKGWHSPCPQLYVGNNAFVGYESIEDIRNMCNYALSKGSWDDSPKKVIPKPCKSDMHHWKDLGDDHSVCTKCDIESHQKVGKQMVAITPNLYEKLKKAGKLENRRYFIYQSWADIKAKTIANIIINDLMKHSSERGCKMNELGLSSYDIWWFAELIFHNVLDRSKITKVIDHFINFGGEVKEIIGSLGLWPTYDEGALEEAVDKVISDNPKIVKQILGGKEKALGSLIGRLKQVDRNIDSKEAMTLLKEKIHV